VGRNGERRRGEEEGEGAGVKGEEGVGWRETGLRGGERVKGGEEGDSEEGGVVLLAEPISELQGTLALGEWGGGWAERAGSPGLGSASGTECVGGWAGEVQGRPLLHQRYTAGTTAGAGGGGGPLGGELADKILAAVSGPRGEGGLSLF